MENLRLHDKFKNVVNFILKRNNKSLEIVEERPISKEHGFQLTKEDYGVYLRHFLPKEISKDRIISINQKGYMSEETGASLKALIDDPEHDIYIKNVRSSQIESIMNEGIRCLDSTSSLPTLNPDTIDKVYLEHTVTEIDDLTMMVEHVKGNNGINVAGNIIDGTMILKVPKGTTKEELLYYNSDTNTFNIHPNYIVGFLPVDKEHKVGDWILPNLEKDENKAL